MKTRLEHAITFACQVHEGRLDKGGQLDILHAFRVMLKVSDQLRIPAVLHDVLEEGATTVVNDNIGTIHVCHSSNDVRFFELSKSEFHILTALTRQAGEPYHNYILRVREDTAAMMIKIADLEDHLHLSRLQNIPVSLINRYLDALKTLNG